MSETRPRLTIMTIFSFLCIFVFLVSSSVQADSGEMIDLKGTGSAGSFSYGGDSIKKESAPLNFISTNILNHVTKDELRGVRIAKTSLRVFARMIK